MYVIIQVTSLMPWGNKLRSPLKHEKSEPPAVIKLRRQKGENE